MPEWAKEFGILWGPGILILTGLFLLLKRALPQDFLGAFLQAEQQQAEAFQQQASAFQELARAVREQGGGYAAALSEIGYSQQVILDRLEQLKGKLEGPEQPTGERYGRAGGGSA